MLRSTIYPQQATHMNRRFTKPLAVAAALGALASSALAGPTSEWRYIGEFQPEASTAGLATGPFQSAAGLGTHFDASSWDGGSAASPRTRASALTLDAQTAAAATDASVAAADERRHALDSSMVARSPVVGSPAAVELTLWNFINSIRAQQVGNAFVQLQATAANIDYTINGVPAPVPLPPAQWLFAGGLAVLTLARLLVRSGPSCESAGALPTR